MPSGLPVLGILKRAPNGGLRWWMTIDAADLNRKDDHGSQSLREHQAIVNLP